MYCISRIFNEDGGHSHGGGPAKAKEDKKDKKVTKEQEKKSKKEKKEKKDKKSDDEEKDSDDEDEVKEEKNKIEEKVEVSWYEGNEGINVNKVHLLTLRTLPCV